MNVAESTEKLHDNARYMDTKPSQYNYFGIPDDSIQAKKCRIFDFFGNVKGVSELCDSKSLK